MNLSGPIITELARTWTFLHGSAAEAHLNHMADRLQRSGDLESAATFRRILDRIPAVRVESAEGPDDSHTGGTTPLSAVP